MNSDVLDISSLATYLRRDAREVEKLASQGRLPGRRVGGDWRFSRDEVNRWLEEQLPSFSDLQLDNVERGAGAQTATEKLELLVAPLLCPERIEIPLQARTANGVIERLVKIANRGWQIYDPQHVVAAIRAREEQSSTALSGGVAIPHARRPTADIVGQSLIAFGRTLTGIPFGGPHGQLTDLFFLILCLDDRQHLQVLARLTRLFHRADMLDQLRDCTTSQSCYHTIEQSEAELLSEL